MTDAKFLLPLLFLLARLSDETPDGMFHKISNRIHM